MCLLRLGSDSVMFKGTALLQIKNLNCIYDYERMFLLLSYIHEFKLLRIVGLKTKLNNSKYFISQYQSTRQNL